MPRIYEAQRVLSDGSASSASGIRISPKTAILFVPEASAATGFRVQGQLLFVLFF